MSHSRKHDTQEILNEIRQKNDAIDRAIENALKNDDPAQSTQLRGFQEPAAKSKAYFGKLLKNADNISLPLTESQVISDISHHDAHQSAEGDAKESIETMKVERTCPTFLKAIREDRDLWTLFLEHFRSEEAFIYLIEKGRMAGALSGVMKMFVDFYSIQEHTKRASKLKQEIELLEKHKAFLLTSNAQIRRSLNIDGEPLTESASKKGKAFDGFHSYRTAQGGHFLDPNDAADKDIIRNIVSPRSDSQNYELVYNTHIKKALGTSDRNYESQNKSGAGWKRPLPTYDIERLQRLAEQAESSAKYRVDHRSGNSYNIGRGGSASNSRSPGQAQRNQFAEDAYDHREGRMDQHRPRRVKVDETGEPILTEPSKRYDSKDSPLAKLDSRRQDLKRMKSKGMSDSETPSPSRGGSAQKNAPEEPKQSFIEKMMKYDYSGLARPKTDDAKNGGKTGPRGSAGVQDHDHRFKSHNINNQKAYQSDDENGPNKGQVSNKDKESSGLDEATPGQSQKDKSLAISKQSGSREQMEAELRARLGRPRSPDGASVKSKDSSKKLVPLVPENEKNDVYAKVNLDKARKERKEKQTSGKGGASNEASGAGYPSKILESEDNNAFALGQEFGQKQHELSRNDRNGSREEAGGASSLSRERRHPKLDNKNLSYRPSHNNPSKNFMFDISKPNYKGVKSSNYGTIEPYRSQSSRVLLTEESKSKEPRFKDVRSLVDSILKDGKSKGETSFNRPQHDQSRIEKSRLKDSVNRSADRSIGSMRSNSPGDFGTEIRGDLYDRKKLDPLTSHQQKRHFPERDQFIHEAGYGIVGK